MLTPRQIEQAEAQAAANQMRAELILSTVEPRLEQRAHEYERREREEQDAIELARAKGNY